jgi:C4-type Zn-finger protein
MLYVKATINDSVEIKIDLYSDNVYTTCPVCGKEHEVCIDDYIGSTLDSILYSQIFCKECSAKYREQRKAKSIE